jgi:hypothetical protein
MDDCVCAAWPRVIFNHQIDGLRGIPAAETMPYISRCQPYLRCAPFPSSLFTPTFSQFRSLVTSVVSPPIDTPLERPETMVLIESNLYKQQWRSSFSLFYPSRGIQFASIDITASNHEQDETTTTLESMEQTLSRDISSLSESAYTILIARGPIQSLVAQYYLESLPLAGLVLVDPLILPEDGRNGVADGRWMGSVETLLTMINDATIDGMRSRLKPNELKDETCTTTSLSRELDLLQSLVDITHRPLFLEQSSIPMLVLYSCPNAANEDYYEKCAETTAKFHSSSVKVLKIPSNVDGEGDLEWTIKQIYLWYDDCVA